MKVDVINIDPKILGSVPVFKGTRVPVSTLLGNLESGTAIDIFSDDFPGVTRE